MRRAIGSYKIDRRFKAVTFRSERPAKRANLERARRTKKSFNKRLTFSKAYSITVQAFCIAIIVSTAYMTYSVNHRAQGGNIPTISGALGAEGDRRAHV